MGDTDRENGAENVSNKISGGVFFHAVIQGHDITVQLPPEVTPALSGLPPASPSFTGRDTHISDLLEGLDPAQQQEAILVTSGRGRTAVAGLPGVGKTELVVQTAQRALKNSGWFPGGVLFIDLFGYDTERRLSPEQALGGLLRALGMPGEHIPPGAQERSRLYRSVLAAFAEQDRRILLVIDNASSAEQVEPLLPTDGTSATLLTSRHTLDIGARLHDLDILNQQASIELLGQVLLQARGPSDTRVADEPDAAAALSDLCAGLPLALRIAAALLADSPTRPLTSLVQALQSEHTRLQRLCRDDRAVRAAFDLSYQLLDEHHARMFRLLSLNPGPGISTEAAAHLTGANKADAEQLLQNLARAHLIEVGHRWGRWHMHDLVRLYAVELQHCVESRNALDRLHDYYLTTAVAASENCDTAEINSCERRISSSPDKAGEWMDQEYSNLVAIATGSLSIDLPYLRLAISGLLVPQFQKYRLLDDWLSTATSAVHAAQKIGDPHIEATALILLGAALAEGRQFRRAADAYNRSAQLYKNSDDRHGQGVALSGVGGSLNAMGDFNSALPVLRRAVAVLRNTSDPEEFGRAMINLGKARAGRGEFDDAIAISRKAVSVLQKSGNRHGVGEALFNLGTVLHKAAQAEQSVAALRQASEVFRKTGNSRLQETAADYINLVHADRTQEIKPFVDFLNAATASSEESAITSYGEKLLRRGVILFKSRRTEEAASILREAVNAFQQNGPRLSEGDASMLLGLSLLLGNGVHASDEAINALESAVAVYKEMGERQRESLALRGTQFFQAFRHMKEANWSDAISVLLPALNELADSDQKRVRTWLRPFRKGR